MKRNEHEKYLIVAGVGIGYYIWLKLTGLAIPCMFRKITGWLCPGCGITTLILCLAKMDFKGAYQANPFLFVTGPFLLLCLFYMEWKRRKGQQTGKVMQVGLVLYTVGLCAFGVIRNMGF